MAFLYTLLGRYLASRPDQVERLIRRAKLTPYSDIKSRDGSEYYMRRWWLFNAYENTDGTPIERNWFMDMLPSVRVHHILLEDNDSHLHDHPWDARSIILRGFYIEERLNPEFEPWIVEHPTNPRTYQVWRRLGDIVRLNFGEYHRITQVPNDGVFTLFITYKYRGTWGFLVDGKKVPWRKYLGIGEKS